MALSDVQIFAVGLDRVNRCISQKQKIQIQNIQNRKQNKTKIPGSHELRRLLTTPFQSTQIPTSPKRCAARELQLEHVARLS
jgi:hypothetical protein